MKIKAEKLINHIEKARVGGLVNEVVLDENLSFCVTDDAKSVLAISNLGLGESGFEKIGIFDLGLFVKAIQFASTQIFSADEDLNFTVEENYLVFKKGKSEFKFLLSSPEAIGSTVQNVDDIFKRVQASSSIDIKIKKEDFDVVSKSIELIVPERVTMYVEEGKVCVLVGITTQHNAVVCIGETKSKSEFKIQFHPAVFVKLIQVLPFNEEITMELRKDTPVVFSSEYYTFVIAPMKEQ